MKCVSVQNRHVYYFLRHAFTFHDSSSARAHYLCLFSYQTYSLLVKVYLSRALRRVEQELSFRIIAICSRYVIRKAWIQVLWILHFVVYFSSEAVLHGLSKNNQRKNQVDAKIQVTLKNVPAQNWIEEKKFMVYSNKLWQKCNCH